MKILNQLSVEPVLFLYFVTYAISTVAITGLLIDEVCGTGEIVNKDDACGMSSDILQLTALYPWRKNLQYSIPVAFILCAGAWSDTHGKRRNPLMIMPITGEIVTLFFVTGSVYYWKWSPEFTAVFETLLRSLTGGRTCFSIGAVTYTCDNTTSENRTFRLAVLTGLIFITTPVGGVIGTLLQASFGFYIMLNICLILNLFTLLSALFFLNRYSDEVPVEKSCGFSELLKIGKTVFKKRVGYKRATVILVLAVSPLFGGCLLGEYSVVHSYLKLKFHWSNVDYSLYAAFWIVLTFFGAVVSIHLLSRVFRLSDAALGLLATTSQLLATVGIAVVHHPWQIFLYPTLDLLHGIIYTVAQSIVSKAVQSSELGKINSVLGALDSLVPLLVFPLYKFYSHAFHQETGSYYIVSVLFACAMFLIILLFKKSEETPVHAAIV